MTNARKKVWKWPSIGQIDMQSSWETKENADHNDGAIVMVETRARKRIAQDDGKKIPSNIFNNTIVVISFSIPDLFKLLLCCRN